MLTVYGVGEGGSTPVETLPSLVLRTWSVKIVSVQRLQSLHVQTNESLFVFRSACDKCERNLRLSKVNRFGM